MFKKLHLTPPPYPALWFKFSPPLLILEPPPPQIIIAQSLNGKTPFWILRSLFLPEKKSTLGFCRLLKDLSLRKWEKKPSSHIIHSLGGEYCWIVRDSEQIRLLNSPRSLSVYILALFINRINIIPREVIFLFHDIAQLNTASIGGGKKPTRSVAPSWL